MTLKRAIIIVVLAGIVFSGIGGAVGRLLGIYSPEYYRTVFEEGDDPDFDPVQMGTSLGLMQGMIAGLVIAGVVIGLMIWRDSFKARLAEEPDVGYVSAARSRAGFWVVIWCIALVLSVAFVGTVAYVAGGLVGQQQHYQRERIAKHAKIDEILADYEFPDITTGGSHFGDVFLYGSVKDQASLDQLRHELVLAFGTETADEMLEPVNVKVE